MNNATKRRRTIRTAAVATVVAALGATALTAGAAAAQAEDLSGAGATGVERRDPAPAKGEVEHDLDGPFSKQQEAERKEALQRVLSGEAKAQRRGASQVLKLDQGKYVEMAREKTDKIFTVLVEFGDKVDDTTMFDPDGPDGPEPPVIKYGGTPGPQHNRIAEPDRADDNTTEWMADFDRSHFQDLYFSDADGKESLKKYYEKQSSGRYSVDGTVSDWVRVEWNEARYGGNYCGQSTCASVWDAVRDGVNQWTADQKAAGSTTEEIKAQLAQYDAWDRYDFDGDGNFNEPDGYIDHFQIVHAGEDESAGGGAQGEDAIWAHRWYAYGTNVGRTGPADNRAGGTQIGDTGVWVGDYTVQPENGGLGVYAHEYGHDLGLPDHYDTSGGGDNSTGFWTLMSSGSWLGTGGDAIGDLPGDLTAWDKLQLGWLDYDTATAATPSSHELGVAEYNTARKQALVVELPEKTRTTTITAPAEGTQQWWSGMGDDLSNTLTRPVDLTGVSTAELSLKGWWDIEADYDYLYAEVSEDGGANWTPLDGTADGASIPRDGGGMPALTGVSGVYKSLVYPMDAYAGKKVDLRFRYLTDGGVAQMGFAADAITISGNGQALFTDGAEVDDNGWTAGGFSRVGESFTKSYPQYYVAENRQYVSYDRTLQVGPYNFGWTSTRPNWVEHYPYQNGLAIWLWDTSQSDNNTSVHPGEGLLLPIDAHARPERWRDGTVMRNRIQSYDSPFGFEPTEGMTLHKDGQAAEIHSKQGVPVFDDHRGTYWYASNPTGSVKVTDTNTRISIVKEAGDGSWMKVLVGPAVR